MAKTAQARRFWENGSNWG